MADAILLIIMALSLVALYLLLKSGFKVAPPPSGTKPAGASYLPTLPGAAPAQHWSDGGRLQTEVMAESRYQGTVRQLAGEHGEQNANVPAQAILAVDEHNPYEDKPVAVFISGQMVGYLSPRDTVAFHKQQARQEITGQAVSCDAAIRGGGLWQGKRLSYAVWLDIEPGK
ncbi:MAG: hypothetical protein V4724_17955 [Pseudomonadota bacterium]